MFTVLDAHRQSTPQSLNEPIAVLQCNSYNTLQPCYYENNPHFIRDSQFVQ